MTELCYINRVIEGRAGPTTTLTKPLMEVSDMATLTPTQIARFWSKVDVKRHDGACWEWTGKKTGHGYGIFRIGPRDGLVNLCSHRVAYELVHGPVPEGLFVLHSCDNRPCCNPAHLRAGTAQDNSDDAVERGRTRTGTAKLSHDDVRFIRDNPQISGKEMAERFGVVKSTISMLRSRKTYAKA